MSSASKTLIYQTQQIRALEQIAKQQFGIAEDDLMQRAGQAAFDFLLRRWPAARKIAVFCGGGNNGGDGYVLASLAHDRGYDVSIWQVGDQSRASAVASAARQTCQAAGIAMAAYTESTVLGHPDLIIDALCGIGLQGQLRDGLVQVIHQLNSSAIPILALDIPTGLNADTGQMLGAAIQATATITFIGFKLGLLTGQSVSYTGELICHELGLPEEVFAKVPPVASKIQLSAYAALFKPRAKDWHKGLSGHVLVIGGAPGFAGAPRMAAEAALRVGAGLVTVATDPAHAGVLTAECPEIMCHAVTDSAKLNVLLARATAIVLGPGLSQSEWAHDLWEKTIAQTLPMVIDADALNLLAQQPRHHDNWVLTPHPGEAARLLGVTTAEIQADRLAAAIQIQRQYGGVCVLKGAGSLVIAADDLPGLCDKGNPGMATAGMGDVLSGVIGGLLAGGLSLIDAAKIGVVLHATAGDLAAKQGERGMIAMDLMPYLRQLVNQARGVS